MLKDILQEIRRGKVSPCYLLWGEDDYSTRKALDSLIEEILPPGDRTLSLFYIEGEQEDPDLVVEAVRTPALLSGRKVVVIRDTNLFRSKSDAPSLLARSIESLERDPRKAAGLFMQFLGITGWSWDDLRDEAGNGIPDAEWKRMAGDAADRRRTWLPRLLALCEDSEKKGSRKIPGGDGGLETALKQGLPEGNCVIFTASGIDQRKALFKTVAALGVVVNFAAVKGESKQKELARGILREEVEKEGKILTPEALETLGKQMGYDPRRMVSEIGKLASLLGDKKVIDRSDVESAVDPLREESVFSLTEAAARRDAADALRLFNVLTSQGVHYLAVLSLLIRELRLLLQAKLFLRTMQRPPGQGMEFGHFQASVYPQVKKWAEGGDLASIHPFVVFNLLKASRNFEFSELFQLLDYSLETDRLLKTTGTDPLVLLESFISKFAK
ncbi:MAG: DNA polymerase III subunit delta [Syntrophales bacterium]